MFKQLTKFPYFKMFKSNQQIFYFYTGKIPFTQYTALNCLISICTGVSG